MYWMIPGWFICNFVLHLSKPSFHSGLRLLLSFSATGGSQFSDRYSLLCWEFTCLHLIPVKSSDGHNKTEYTFTISLDTHMQYTYTLLHTHMQYTSTHLYNTYRKHSPFHQNICTKDAFVINFTCWLLFSHTFSDLSSSAALLTHIISIHLSFP